MRRKELGTINIPKKLIGRVRIFCNDKGFRIYAWLEKVIEKALQEEK